MAPLTPPRSTRNTDPLSKNKRQRAFDAGMEYVGPKDPAFKTNILSALDVYISTSPLKGTELKNIFGENQPTMESRVVINKDDAELEKIIRNFRMCQTLQYDEATLFIICTDGLVLREQFIDVPLVGEGKPIKLLCAKIGGSPNRTAQVFRTMEKTGKATDATYQNTAVSVLWLYQRKKMRQELGRSLDDLKHFSISFVDSNYTIWEAGFFENALWYVREIVWGAVTNVDGLKLYIKWSNAIHSWGLGTNADSFKNDVEALLGTRRTQQAFPTPPVQPHR